MRCEQLTGQQRVQCNQDVRWTVFPDRDFGVAALLQSHITDCWVSLDPPMFVGLAYICVCTYRDTRNRRLSLLGYDS